MERVTGSGAWPGKAAGRVVWVGSTRQWDRTPVADRAAELLRFRAELGRALADVEAWSERQPTVEARLVLQRYRDALLEEAWARRTAALIDGDGLPAPAAAVDAAAEVAAVMGRDEALRGQASALISAAEWLAGRLAPQPLPSDAVLAADGLSPLQLLDRQHPALIAAGEPVLAPSGPPLVWGVPGLGPRWEGRWVIVDGAVVTLEQTGVGLAPESSGGAPAGIARREELRMRYAEVREAVCNTARQMARDSLVRLTSGNVSARIPGTDLFAVTPSGMDYETLTPEDICVLDLSGRVVEGARRPSTETPLHRLTYERRPEVGGVVHTHSIYASAFACTGQDLPVISTELAALVGGTVRCAPYAPSGTEAFAQTALDTLGAEDVAVLFQNHGVMAAGATLEEAYAIAVGIEEAAMIYFLAKQLGNPIVLPEEERRRMFREHRRSYGQPRKA